MNSNPKVLSPVNGLIGHHKRFSKYQEFKATHGLVPAIIMFWSAHWSLPARNMLKKVSDDYLVNLIKVTASGGQWRLHNKVAFEYLARAGQLDSHHALILYIIPHLRWMPRRRAFKILRSVCLVEKK